jgi:hypothetical protein
MGPWQRTGIQLVLLKSILSSGVYSRWALLLIQTRIDLAHSESAWEFRTTRTCVQNLKSPLVRRSTRPPLINSRTNLTSLIQLRGHQIESTAATQSSPWLSHGGLTAHCCCSSSPWRSPSLSHTRPGPSGTARRPPPPTDQTGGSASP